MSPVGVVRRVFRPLGSRKVRVALTTVIAALAAEWGFEVRDEVILTILAVGASVILGIAHEDAGKLASGRLPGPQADDE